MHVGAVDGAAREGQRGPDDGRAVLIDDRDLVEGMGLPRERGIGRGGCHAGVGPRRSGVGAGGEPAGAVP